MRLTIDPVEFRGFRYETGVSVTVYAPGRHEELGRGGRYLCGETEPATGLTLFPDAVLRVAPQRAARARVLVPFGASQDAAAALRSRGFATVAALAPVPDEDAEARRLECSHVLRGGEAVALAGGDSEAAVSFRSHGTSTIRHCATVRCARPAVRTGSTRC